MIDEIDRTGGALLCLRNITKEYQTGEGVVRALDQVCLTVDSGDFVVIVGPSGSGKSTLLNTAGLIDKQTTGEYLLDGVDVSGLSGDAVAMLRCHNLGILLQHHCLLPKLSAVENVELAGIYAGSSGPVRRREAEALLGRLGLYHRSEHRPDELSGGELQRVALARALMNGRRIVLADEPTASLDAAAAENILDYLQELNQEGYTLILVTHDPAVVARASRVVRIAHGRVVSDKRQSACSARSKQPAVIPRVAGGTRWFEVASQGAILGWRCLYGNLFRTMLTLAGFIIGVAAILVTLAVSEGGRLEVLNRIAAVGTNLLIVRPGGAGIRTIGELGQLQPEDAAEIKKLDNIELASPERGGRYTVRAGGVDYQTTIIGTSAEFVVARSWPLASGAFFSAEEEQAYAPIAVLGKTVEAMLFPDGGSVGRHVLLMGTPYEVIGVLSARGGAGSGADQDDMVVIPLSTSLMRLFGRRYVNIITVRVHEQAKLQSTRNEITRLLMDRHRMRQFQTVEMSAMIALGTETHAQLTLTLSIVSVVSLVLAGGGMMNVMLAGLFERAREIGIRQISGAQPWSIILQLNVEAVVFGTVGGFLGALLGWVTVTLLSALGIPTMIGIGDVLLAFGCACFFAAAFGHIPARHASKLSPARAISWR